VTTRYYNADTVTAMSDN